MDLTNKRPEDVLKTDSLNTYKELHKDIWDRLIHVGTNLTILEKIQKFPFDCIYAPENNIFWNMVHWNFRYVSILYLHTLANDQGDEKHAIDRFANRILNDWMCDSYKSEYQSELRKTKLDKRLKYIRDKIRDIRHNVIAHRLLDDDRSSLKQVEGVKLDELRQVYEDIEDLFRTISFGTEYVSNFYVGGSVGGKLVKEDIDELLDLILKNSYWINEPEKKKDSWPCLRKTRSQEELLQLNEYRSRFGMPPA